MSSSCESIPVAIGIDLGTTNSCVAFFDRAEERVKIIPNEFGHRTTPSYIGFQRDATEVLVGETAKRQQLRNPKNTIYESKRFIGYTNSDIPIQEVSRFPFNVLAVGEGDEKLQIHVCENGEDRLYYPEEISALILLKMKAVAQDFIGQQITKAVITVPAYFNDSQRQATREAGCLAGLEVLRIINEPTAAAIAYGLDHNNKEIAEDTEKMVLVFDIGGGTIDTSLLSISGDGIFEVLAISGDTHLGGADFDTLLMRKADEIFQKSSLSCPSKSAFDDPKALRRLRMACEKAKCELSGARMTVVDVPALMDGEDLMWTVTRDDFEEMCEPLFDKCMEFVKQTLKDANVQAFQVDEIVLVGGSTRIPKLQQLLSNFFADASTNTPKALCKSINPDEAVAYGAALQAASLNSFDILDGIEVNNVPDFVLLDVNPLSLGVETKGGLMSVLIPRNTTIPITRSKLYTTEEDNQVSVNLRIFEGERSETRFNNLLGDFELSGIKPADRGDPKIEVIFEVDADGIFTVRARDVTDGLVGNDSDGEDLKELKVTITSKTSMQDKDLIENIQADAEEHRQADESYKRLVLARTQYENLLYGIRKLVTKDERVLKSIDESDKGMLLDMVAEELKWIKSDIALKITDPKEIYDKADGIQRDFVNPVLRKINTIIRAE